MKYEPTQPGNPHKFTLNQHVFPKASIERFAGEDGCVEIYSIPHRKVLRLKPNNPIFCAQRVWDQKTEAAVSRRIEDKFQALADAIERGTVTTIGIWEKRTVEQFFSLWRTRQKFRVEGLEDVRLHGVEGESLTKAQEGTRSTLRTEWSRGGCSRASTFLGMKRPSSKQTSRCSGASLVLLRVISWYQIALKT